MWLLFETEAVINPLLVWKAEEHQQPDYFSDANVSDEDHYFFLREIFVVTNVTATLGLSIGYRVYF